MPKSMREKSMFLTYILLYWFWAFFQIQKQKQIVLMILTHPQLLLLSNPQQPFKNIKQLTTISRTIILSKTITGSKGLRLKRRYFVTIHMQRAPKHNLLQISRNLAVPLLRKQDLHVIVMYYY